MDDVGERIPEAPTHDACGSHLIAFHQYSTIISSAIILSGWRTNAMYSCRRHSLARAGDRFGECVVRGCVCPGCCPTGTTQAVARREPWNRPPGRAQAGGSELCTYMSEKLAIRRKRGMRMGRREKRSDTRVGATIEYAMSEAGDVRRERASYLSSTRCQKRATR